MLPPSSLRNVAAIVIASLRSKRGNPPESGQASSDFQDIACFLRSQTVFNSKLRSAYQISSREFGPLGAKRFNCS